MQAAEHHFASPYLCQHHTEMSLLSEVRRRHVIRVAVAYLAVAWLLAQVADVVLVSLLFSAASAFAPLQHWI
ncbi:MAG: hypothetical protein PVF50_03480 [Gammaproteobacteria bacterium]